MMSWLLALLTSSQVPYELLALVFIRDLGEETIGIKKRILFKLLLPFSIIFHLNSKSSKFSDYLGIMLYEKDP